MSDILEIKIVGRLDAARSGALEKELEEAVHAGHYHLRLNLAEADFLSSAGLRALLQAYRALRRLNGSFAVTNPAPAVAEVLRLSGLLELVAAEDPAAPAAATPAAATRTVAGLDWTLYPLAPGAAMRCRLVGDPARLAAPPFTAAETSRLRLPPDTLAVGLGAFGPDFAACRNRFGEFLAAGGAAICLPADGSKAPDYLLARGALVPEAQVLYALVGTGAFAACGRFETGPDPAALPQLAAAALAIGGAPACGWVLLAETAGLVGAALKRSPAAAAGSPFDYPGARHWLDFTSEREFARTLALVAGFAAGAEADPALDPFLRPAGRAPRTAVHAHAAVFSLRALPRGQLPLAATLAALCDEQRLLGLLHLLGDCRELSGSGESLFTRGALWVAPLSGVERTGEGA